MGLGTALVLSWYQYQNVAAAEADALGTHRYFQHPLQPFSDSFCLTWAISFQTSASFILKISRGRDEIRLNLLELHWGVPAGSVGYGVFH